MNRDDFVALAARAASVSGREDTRLREVLDRISAARRRRFAGAVAATVVAVVLALTLTPSLFWLTSSGPIPPAKPPQPTPTQISAERELVWAKGNVIHIGDQKIDVGGKVWEVDATNDGAVFMRQAKGDCFKYATGCNDLWFTDGNEIIRIGTIYGSVIRGFEFYGASGGSTVMWFEPSPEYFQRGSGYDETGEYVVYDTHQRREVARLKSDTRSSPLWWVHKVQAVFDDYVYWIPDETDKEWCRGPATRNVGCADFRSVMRLDIATGSQEKVPWSTYLSDRRSRPRMFSELIPGWSNTAYSRYAEAVYFKRVGDRLVADHGDGGYVTPRVASTGEPLRLRVPAGYDDGEHFRMVTWLDDEHIALMAGDADLLVCRLPDGLCRTEVKEGNNKQFGPAADVGVAGFRAWG